MKSEKLSKTNMIDNNKVIAIEFFLGKEIEDVYNYVDGYKKGSIQIAPGTPLSIFNYSFGFKHIKEVSFDSKNGVITVVGRNKYERSFTKKEIQLKLVGYKLPTTSIAEGWIWGNGIVG